MTPFTAPLLVEDEVNLAAALEIALRKLKLKPRVAHTIGSARALIAEQEPDFILLDRNLPDGDGLALCSSLRQSGYQGTILILTANGQVEDRVAGLNEGADDYLPKPFSWPELEARIRALGRRRTSGATAPSVAGLWSIDEARLRIRGPAGWVELTPLEFRLAHRLMSSAGAIISRDELLKDVWGFALRTKTRTVDLFLSRLRKRFEATPEEPTHFLTVRGAGYRFER